MYRIAALALAFVMLSGCSRMVSKSETLENVLVEVTSARLEPEKGDTPAYLVIELRITNKGGSDVAFDAWSKDLLSTGGASVKDDAGGTYGGLPVQSQPPGKITLQPKKSFNEMLFISKPSHAAQRLQLRLPGKNVGVSGEFVLDCTPLGGCGPRHCAAPPSTPSP